MQEADGSLSAKGRCMARLPLDPPLASILLAAAARGCAADAVALVSMLSTDRIFVTPTSKCASLPNVLSSALSDIGCCLDFVSNPPWL